ncbi:MAG: hypothetical protein WBZ04_11035, partial [Candidatus Nanopelagicales bacterium]
STPSTRSKLAVGVSPLGLVTPHRNVIGGSPQAAVVGVCGSVVRRTAFKTELGSAWFNWSQASTTAALVGCGAGTVTGPAQAQSRPTARAALPAINRYTKMTLVAATKGLAPQCQMSQEQPVSGTWASTC